MIHNKFFRVGVLALFGAVLLLLPTSKLDKAENEQYMQQLAQGPSAASTEQQKPVN